jgi:preprotein translocase subunit YajC
MPRELLTEKEAALKSPTRPMQDTRETVNGNMVMEGVFQNSIQRNQNGRIYPKALWDRVLSESSDWTKRVRDSRVGGHLEHPDDGITRLSLVSHRIIEARQASEREIYESKRNPNPTAHLIEGDILGKLEIFDTPHGQVLKALTPSLRWGVSSRGSGSVMKTPQGLVVESHDFELDTWDAVYNPSVSRAIPRLVENVVDGRSIQESIRDLVDGKELVQEAHPLPEGTARVIVHYRKDNAEYTVPVLVSGDLTERAALERAHMVFTESKKDCTFVRAAVELGGFRISHPVQAFMEAFDKGDRVETESGLVMTVESNDFGTVGKLVEGDTTTEVLASNSALAEHELIQLALKKSGGKGFKPRQITEAAKSPDQPATPPSTPPPTPTKKMSKLAEMTAVRTRALRLAATPVKGSSLAIRAGALSESDTLSVEAQGLLGEDPSLSAINEEVQVIIKDFRKALNESDFPPAADDAGAPPADVAPPVDDVAPEEPSALADTLTSAADKLRELGGDDPEIAELAATLDDEAIAAGGGAAEGDDAAAAEAPPLPPMTEAQAKRALRNLRLEHKKLNVAATRLLGRYEKLRTNVTESRKAKINEATEQTAEYEKAAKHLAEMYNKDMKDLSLQLLEATNPAFHKAHAATLTECKSFKAFQAKVKTLVQEDVEATNKRKLEESSNQTPPKAADQPKAPVSTPPTAEEGALHESLSMVRRARRL